ncbi:MAG TPA: hypothetical protein VLL08_20060 [Kineosporiaceae bacterium]|nr:hypothetical protein [Kineosporiaceae bacterium]
MSSGYVHRDAIHEPDLDTIGAVMDLAGEPVHPAKKVNADILP